jgi:WhiB family transcriptional regulator, redox-sensing transcriptional regulator
MPRPHEVAAARRDPRLLRALQERDDDLTWRARGLCQSVDPELFFPAPSEPADAAVALCRTCDVQGACLAWALEVGDCHGVWGATTPRERRAMLVAWHSDEFARSATSEERVPQSRAPESQPAQLTAAPATAAAVPEVPESVAPALPAPRRAVSLPIVAAVVRPARELATSA